VTTSSIRVIDERIERAKRVLLADLRPVTKDTTDAKVYVLTTSNTHEWVPIEGPLSVAAAADLVRDLHARDNGVQFQVSRGELTMEPGSDRTVLLRALAEALSARGVYVSPVDPPMFAA
jgi:hypothetical protein